MQFWVSITAPTSIRPRLRWPAFAPVPAIGDHVMLRAGDVLWSFRVINRSIGVGTDPATGQPAAQASLTVDVEAPDEWDANLLP